MFLSLLTLSLLDPALADTPPEPSSVWDELQVDKGVHLSDQEKEASQDLADERFDEQLFGGMGALGGEPDPRFYVDPVGTLEVDPLHLDLVAPADFDIPVVVNPMVEKWMNYFLGRGRKWFQKYLEREHAYRPMIHAELAAAGMPLDLIYVSMIESGFSNQARSFASAVGLWQFMAPTARAYGLRVDYWSDERTDPEASTRAAIQYLSDLYDLQGDWYLAWASYNAGPGRVNGAIKRHGTRNFWVIAQQETLAEETRNYVPKVLAAAIIGKHPERYGFEVEPHAELRYQSVEVHGAVTLDIIADCAETTEARITELNPALLRGATPPDGTTLVHLPEGSAEGFATCFEAIPPSERISYSRHQVARGETLSGIAKRYGVTSADIENVNRLANANRIYVGMELVIPLKGIAPELVAKAEAPRTTTVHTVTRGETLSAISTRYGVTVSQLKGWNSLNSDTIQAGQRLTIEGGKPQSTTPLSYTVRKGDALSSIARDFGVSTAQVQEWNGISDASSVQVGQVLKLYGPSQDWKVYVVRSGDSLGRIAQANGCSVSELKGWNDLSGSTIHPGQKLRIQAD
ncbi:MAG: LysM peptidoglycan-binding domain-containing protein [Proteobacteria bacterium]|nr:LysM peptidoglycan-binding domain-containing protein [Pseudomonadota bacterium]MCP4916488.1 LysM peptidoglycan-binding domain-containing protein [Pseudomonadota bacterium]